MALQRGAQRGARQLQQWWVSQGRRLLHGRPCNRSDPQLALGARSLGAVRAFSTGEKTTYGGLKDQDRIFDSECAGWGLRRAAGHACGHAAAGAAAVA